MAERVRVVSSGGGVQSTALLVLAARGEIDFRSFIFANVGENSEHPATLRYVREVSMPYASAHGIEFLEIERRRRGGLTETLLDRLRAGSRAIPAYREKDGPPMSRSCTVDFKVRPVAKELRRRGATKKNPALVALGISVDEIQRAHPGIDERNPIQERVYPLLDLGLHRRDCYQIAADAGLPTPPKSACWFCPHHSMEAWRTLQRQTPELFEAAVLLEDQMTDEATDGRPVFLTRHGIPLDRAVGDEQLTLAGSDCESGWCMT